MVLIDTISVPKDVIIFQDKTQQINHLIIMIFSLKFIGSFFKTSYNLGRAARVKYLPNYMSEEIDYNNLLNKLEKDGRISSKDLKFIFKGAKGVL